MSTKVKIIIGLISLALILTVAVIVARSTSYEPADNIEAVF